MRASVIIVGLTSLIAGRPAAALELSMAQGARRPTVKQAVVELVFTNDGARPVRLLDEHTRGGFSPERFGIWFEVEIALLMRGGRRAPLEHKLRGGKIAIRRPMRYVSVPARRPHRVVLDLARIATLLPGTYALSATYRNSYGQSCFMGTLKSSELVIQIGPAGPRILPGHASRLALIHGMLVDGLSFPSSMRSTVKERGAVFLVEWHPAKTAGFYYRVLVDKTSGRILSAHKKPHSRR